MDYGEPEIAKLFVLDGDGLGDTWPGAPGWTGVKINQIELKAIGL